MSGIEVLRRGDGPPEAAVPKAGASDPSAAAQAPSPTLAVWAARLVTLGALAAIIVYLVYCILTDNRPAQFDIQPDFAALEQRGDAYILPVTVINDSTEAVTNVVLDVSHQAAGEPVTFSLTFALMGEGEQAMAELIFEDAPSEADTTFRVTSYQSP